MADDDPAIQDHKRRLDAFYSGLKPVLRIAEQAQAKLDRHAATAFSVFEYFHDNENALSRIFADLLDPKGRHGQGEAFLSLFLDRLDLKVKPPNLTSCRSSTEHSTATRRRIDIFLEFRGEIPFRIGIENKPWTGDADGQIADYVAYLRSKGDNWVMLYLTGDGNPPSEVSIQQDCWEKYEASQHFHVIPYRSSSAASSTLSLEGWLEDCRQVCEAERVRWFLKDCLDYIRYWFTPSEESVEEMRM